LSQRKATNHEFNTLNAIRERLHDLQFAN
jgi:hypothetical protein